MEKPSVGIAEEEENGAKRGTQVFGFRTNCELIQFEGPVRKEVQTLPCFRTMLDFRTIMRICLLKLWNCSLIETLNLKNQGQK